MRKLSSITALFIHCGISGNLNPSEADITLTKKIVEGANLFDILVLDHLIVTSDGFYPLPGASLPAQVFVPGRLVPIAAQSSD